MEMGTLYFYFYFQINKNKMEAVDPLSWPTLCPSVGEESPCGQFQTHFILYFEW